jgi:5-formyltetrahydrofolate cyclo-ligase
VVRRHDHDAGGDADVRAAKAALREEVWRAMQRPGVARFPGPDGRIPNFVGAEVAAERLRGTAQWRRARTLKSNPDSPQWPVRQRALEDGKTLFMAVPRLAALEPFLRLDSDRLTESARAASSIKGAARHGVAVGVNGLEPVDLVVTGCVAVGEDGARLGKGGGYSDLEFAIARAAGLVGVRTIVVTTVHELQVRPAGVVPTTEHDVKVDLVVTPDRVAACDRGPRHRLPDLDWTQLTPEKIASIPVLRRLSER